MRIGIDISQTAYEGTGVANYLTSLVENLLQVDKENEYILFFSSMRKKGQIANRKWQRAENVTLKIFSFPPKLLDLLWNKLHVMPIEQLIGDVDVFITSDWTEPPTKKAKKATVLYDLIVYKYPEETAANIIKVQQRKLAWAKKEVDAFLCISEATKQDAKDILGLEEEKLTVIYPGFSL